MPTTKTCENCGNSFEISRLREQDRKFCGKPCQKSYESRHGRVASQVQAVELRCKHCDKAFFYKPAYLKEYRKKYDKDPPYCSRKCFSEGKRADAQARNVFTCEACGKIAPMSRREFKGGTAYNRKMRFCSPECRYGHIKKLAAERFNSGDVGKQVKRNGYIYISTPALIDSRKGVFEHRWVMEQHIGRKLLPEETVHHINGDRADNRIENLELFSSRHGPGQRVSDKVAFAIEMLQIYPEIARQQGFVLTNVGTG